MMKNKKGFTIVELSLASAFLGILLITIALLVTQVITIYQKGMTIKAVNESGEDIIDDISRSITASTAVNLVDNYCSSYGQACKNDGGRKILYQQRTISNVALKSTGKAIGKPVPANGAFCTGKFSYIWNSGYVLDDYNDTYVAIGGGSLSSERATLTIGTGSSKTEIKDFHLLKVRDAGREVCRSGLEGGYDNPGKNYKIEAPDVNAAELLEKSEDNLAIYDLKIFPPTFHNTTKHAFYSGTFILATIRGGVNIMATGDYCTDTTNTDSLSSDFAYCAMNKFNFAARATGGENL